MDKNNFKISAEILQKNAMKASIRDLNAEFQMKGGKVIYKTSKNGDTYQLSHMDEEYLEKFRLRLLLELGLIEEKDIPKEAKEPTGPPPRYGEDHKLRRGWNVRSPKEFREGHYNRDEKGARSEGDRYERRDHRDQQQRGHTSRNNYRSGPTRETSPSTYDREHEEVDDSKTFEERWGNVSEYLDLVREALKEGAVDDGEIIKHAYNKKVDKEKIRTLKKILWDNRCRGPRTKCPHGKKKFRFEDLMKVCSGKVEGWDKIDSPFIQFNDLWKENIEKMYGGLEKKIIDVEGKISSYKPVNRKKHEHLKILVYDTIVTPEGSDEKRDTRKLWIKVTKEEYEKLIDGSAIHVDDLISLKGKCIYDSYFHDHWVIDIVEFKVLTSSDGELLKFPES